MTHLLFHVDRTLAILKEQGGDGMAEVVKSHLSQPGLLRETLEGPIREIVRMHEAAGCSAKAPRWLVRGGRAGIDTHGLDD